VVAATDQWVRTPTEVVRPLGAFTVVVQLLKKAKIMIAPTVEKRMFRMVCLVFL